MNVSEGKSEPLSVASLLNPFIITAFNVLDENNIVSSSSASSTGATSNLETHARTSCNVATLELLQSVTRPLANLETSSEDLSLKLEPKSYKESVGLVKKSRRGRLPVHPEMSAEERALWRMCRNRQSAERSRQKRKEYISHLERLLKNAEFSNLLLNRTCMMYASIIQQLQKKLDDKTRINERICSSYKSPTKAVRDHPTAR